MTTKKEIQKLAREAFGEYALAGVERLPMSTLFFGRADSNTFPSVEIYVTHDTAAQARDLLAAALRGIAKERKR